MGRLLTKAHIEGIKIVLYHMLVHQNIKLSAEASRYLELEQSPEVLMMISNYLVGAFNQESEHVQNVNQEIQRLLTEKPLSSK